MNTLAVFYSKTGNTRKVAEIVIKELGCKHAELSYDENTKTIGGAANPSEYERVILLCPIWAFAPAEPMKLYLKEFGASIQSYSLVVTCGMFGLRSCVRNCVKAIGKKPMSAMKIRDKKLKADDFDIKPIIAS